jgi:hypothetical protein
MFYGISLVSELEYGMSFSDGSIDRTMTLLTDSPRASAISFSILNQ